ncbi:MAG TPA: circadian clock KaiB family protein [Daejeonella sp.]|nr:circadian clock KaiB family protein [Daejeonella sp.]
MNENIHENLPEIQNKEESCQLKLFVAGASVNSLRAIENIKSFCKNTLDNHVDLEIIDIYQQPLLAEQEQIIALPLLIRKYPLPERRFIGDLSDTNILLKGLGKKS